MLRLPFHRAPHLLFGLFLITQSACQTEGPASEEPIKEHTAWIASRDTEIPVTLTLPGNTGANSPPVPLIVMLHGHGGSRHESGAFTQVAQALAERGIASIRMDFPGCGDSREPFRNQRLTSMLTDAASARLWATQNANIDTQRLGLLGFSMGGRLAVTLAQQNTKFQTLALWAPSVDGGASALHDFFGGEQNFLAMQRQASREGFAPFTTSWGAQQELSTGWFDDMAASHPLDYLSDYRGNLFVLYGSKDQVVLPEESERALAAAQHAEATTRHIVVGADHGLGLFTNQPEFTREAVAATVAFLSAAL